MSLKKQHKYFWQVINCLVVLLISGPILALDNNSRKTPTSYESARWDPIHFQPLINQASNEQCLQCHMEIIQRKPNSFSSVGINKEASQAWYQGLTTYEGEQDSFHRRHLVTPMAKTLMNLQCNTCHQGNDPREEAPNNASLVNHGFSLRKMVNPEICLMCHGANPYDIMGLPGPWHEVKEIYQNDCLLCHAAIRTVRHQVNFLKPEAIEEAAKQNADVCYGCHGGRQWYRIAYPYPRHNWPGSGDVVPDWAKDRPSQSEARFLTHKKK